MNSPSILRSSFRVPCKPNAEGHPEVLGNFKLDDTEAVKWYRKAADQADAGAQYLLGLSYVGGAGVRIGRP